jgi:hypothetical protein
MSDRHANGITQSDGLAKSTPKRSGRKQRVTFTLSQNSLQFIHRSQKEENIPSLSAALDKLIDDVMRARALDALNASVTAYYDSLSPAQMQEESAWGDVGAEGLAALESESDTQPPESAGE